MDQTLIVKCPNCGTNVSVPADYVGLEAPCPKCRKPFVMCETAKPPPREPRPPTPPSIPRAAAPATKSQNLRSAGWVCFGIGMALLIVCPILPFYFPFFVTSVILAIILLAKESGRGGLALLLTTLLAPVLVGVLMVALGVGALMAAFSGESKKPEQSLDRLTKQVAPPYQTPMQTPSLPRAPAPRPPTPQSVPKPAPVLQPSGQPAATLRPSPTHNVSYDGLLQVLNRYGKEYKSASTTVQKQDVRTRAQLEATKFIENGQMTLIGTVQDVKYNANGRAELRFKSFAPPEAAVQADPSLSVSSRGELTVAMNRDAALAIKSGQKMLVTGTPVFTAHQSLVSGIGDDDSAPSLITFRFAHDVVPLLTLRMRNYSLRLEK